MRADYDSKANAISELQLLYPDFGVEEPIAAVAGRYDLDRGALEAAARSALAVPDHAYAQDARNGNVSR